MIKINLAKKAKASGSSLDLNNLLSVLKIGKQGESGDLKADLKNSPIVRVILAGVIVFLVSSTLDDYRKDALKVVEKQISKIEQETNAVQAKLAQVKGYELAKKQLDEDEHTVRTKLEVITQLLDNRNAPAKMLLQIAQTIPGEVWLSDLNVQGPAIKLAGGTLGYNQVSDFLKSLGDSSMFEDITLNGIQENTAPSPDGKIQTFEIHAKRRNFF